MRSMLLLTFCLTACAPSSKPEAGPQCEMQAWPVDQAYEDAVEYKSSVTFCSDGCRHYTDVNDASHTYTLCDGQ